MSEAEREQVKYLAPEQLVAGTSRPVSRRQLSRRASAALWGLRVFAVALSLMVIYTFAAQVLG